MSNAMMELMFCTARKRAADRLSVYDTRKRANHLIDTHKTDKSVSFHADAGYIRITQCVCPLGNPKPIFNTEYLRKDQLTDDQLKYILQHLG